MIVGIIKAVVSFFSIIDRLAQEYHNNQIREAERNRIENEANKDAEIRNEKLRNELNRPVDVDDLPDDFFADDRDAK